MNDFKCDICEQPIDFEDLRTEIAYSYLREKDGSPYEVETVCRHAHCIMKEAYGIE